MLQNTDMQEQTDYQCSEPNINLQDYRIHYCRHCLVASGWLAAVHNKKCITNSSLSSFVFTGETTY